LAASFNRHRAGLPSLARYPAFPETSHGRKAIAAVNIATVLSSNGLFVAHRGHTDRHYQSARPVESHGGTEGCCRSSQACRTFGNIWSHTSKPGFFDTVDNMPPERRDRRIKATHLFGVLQEQRLRVISVVSHR
jgi:hypothetical protein